MASVEVTFTLDDVTVSRLRDAAERLSKSKGEIVREALHDYCDRIGRLSQRERVAMLRAFDELLPKIPRRSAASVDAEFAGLRPARRTGGRSPS
jgi:predicted transcriptional regulator